MKWIKGKNISILLAIYFLGSSSIYGADVGNEKLVSREIEDTKLVNTQVMKKGGLVKLENVKCLNQFPQLPTGCEATALTMLLNYYDVKVTKEEVARAMPKCDLPYYKKGKRYGYHPQEAFIGNPYSVSSYGVFSKVIVQMIEDYCPGRVEDLSGKELGHLLKNIDEGRPVMLWATIGMSQVSYKNSWIVDQKGTVFTWPGNEHALLLIGYDQHYLYLNDPYTGREEKYARALVEKRYEALGRQAVSINFPVTLEEEGTPTLKEELQVTELIYWGKHIATEINETVFDNGQKKQKSPKVNRPKQLS